MENEVTSRFRRQVHGPWWAAALVAVAPALLSFVVGYAQSVQEANDVAGVVKNKAEAGFQVTRHSVGRLQERIEEIAAELEELRGENLELRRANRTLANKRRGQAARPAPAPAAKEAAKPAPAALPATLDAALEQVTKAAEPAAPAAPPPTGKEK